jgi:hypothetical protein
MSINQWIKPEDILKDGADYLEIDGKKVRKGTVAAFLANIEILENPNTSNQHKSDALLAMKELAPAIITVGLHKHVTFKNVAAVKILAEVESICQ